MNKSQIADILNMQYINLEEELFKLMDESKQRRSKLSEDDWKSERSLYRMWESEKRSEMEILIVAMDNLSISKKMQYESICRMYIQLGKWNNQ